MRILCVTPWFPSRPGDQEGNFIADSVNALVAEGHAVKVLVTRPWRPSLAALFSDEWRGSELQIDAHPPALGLELVRYLSVPRNRWRSLSCHSLRHALAAALRRAVATFSPEVIVVHTEMPAEAVVAAGLPSVVVLHGINTSARLDTPREHQRLRHTLDAATRVVLVGEPLRDYFTARCTRHDHFRVVHNGFLPPASGQCRPPGAWPARRGLVSVSNLLPGKGIDDTLRALALLLQRGVHHWHYTIVGGGSGRGELDALARSLGLLDHVTFAGAVPRADVYAWLARNEVFVLPSWREAFGVAWLEAMGCGLLTIGVQGQGPAAFISDGDTGLLVPPQNPAALADCLQRVLAAPDAMQAIAQRGQAHVTRHFTWAAHARALAAVCAEATGAGR